MSRVPGLPVRALSAGLALAASLAFAPPTAGHGTVRTPFGGMAPEGNDMLPLPAVDFGQRIKPSPVQTNPEPALRPVPRARCGPGSDPLETDVQGRVPASAIDSPAAADGWSCNLRRVANHPTPGGFRTWRYRDRTGHTCAFYDTSLDSPLTALRLAAGPSPGVVVLDMTDPRNPVETARLRSLPMLTPHESLNLNKRRGLLAAEMGNGTLLPGLMSIYDVSEDCRHPVHRSTFLATRWGHESGFSRDGRTYWIGGAVGISAVDVTKPAQPRTLWSGGNVWAHGLSVSRDGNRLYDSDPINGHLVIFDVSEIQARKPNPRVREISRLSWDTVTIPQNSAPIRIGGKPYLLEFDEFGFRFSTVAPPHQVGAARIIDISNEKRPRVISNIRLEVNQPGPHAQAEGDPSPLPGRMFSYSAHYCDVPRAINPGIAACSFINSGLRIFNVENPRRPREVAYYVAPPTADSSQGWRSGNAALSQPAFDPKRRVVWYTDAVSGFHAVKLSKRVWPGRMRR